MSDALTQVRDAMIYPDHNQVDQPDGCESIRLHPTSENHIMNNAELAALRGAGFVVDTIDLDHDEVWVRERESSSSEGDYCPECTPIVTEAVTEAVSDE